MKKARREGDGIALNGDRRRTSGRISVKWRVALPQVYPSSYAGVVSDLCLLTSPTCLASPSQTPVVTAPVMKTPSSPVSIEPGSQSSQVCTLIASGPLVWSLC